MVDMLANDFDAKKHRDLRRTEIERSEANVVEVAEAIVGLVSSIVLSTGHLFPETKDLATLMASLFNKYVEPGWDISIFAKNTKKNVKYRA
jgi:hypothetical protein